MRVPCARASLALAAPSRHFQLFNDISKTGKGAAADSGSPLAGPLSFATLCLSVIIAQPSPALVNTYFSTASITRGCTNARAAS
jgi:hypothetical protein